MIWFVIVPVAWFCTALSLGLLIGRCLSVDDDRQPAAHFAGNGFAAPTTVEDASAVVDSGTAVDRDRSLARTV